MDTIDLSLKMKRLVQWLDGKCQPDSLARKQFHGSPFGDCYVTIDPDRQAPFASANMNRAYLCGTEAGMDFDSIARLIELFAARDVKRFFVWLSPGPDMDTIRRWLEGSGLCRIRRTGYPTLCREERSPVRFARWHHWSDQTCRTNRRIRRLRWFDRQEWCDLVIEPDVALGHEQTVDGSKRRQLAWV